LKVTNTYQFFTFKIVLVLQPGRCAPVDGQLPLLQAADCDYLSLADFKEKIEQKQKVIDVELARVSVINTNEHRDDNPLQSIVEYTTVSVEMITPASLAGFTTTEGISVVNSLEAEPPERISRTKSSMSSPLTSPTTKKSTNITLSRVGEKHDYVCHLCGKSYARPSGLNVHIATFHRQEKPFACEECGKRFGRQDSLVKHRLTHTKEKNYVCEFCSRPFSQSSNLIKHRKTKHLDVARESYRFKCIECSGRYYSRKELAKHIKISHDKIKDHRCVICDARFGGRAVVRRHLKKVHHINDPIINEHFQKLFDILEDY